MRILCAGLLLLLPTPLHAQQVTDPSDHLLEVYAAWEEMVEVAFDVMVSSGKASLPDWLPEKLKANTIAIPYTLTFDNQGVAIDFDEADAVAIIEASVQRAGYRLVDHTMPQLFPMPVVHVTILLQPDPTAPGGMVALIEAASGDGSGQSRVLVSRPAQLTLAVLEHMNGALDAYFRRYHLVAFDSFLHKAQVRYAANGPTHQ